MKIHKLFQSHVTHYNTISHGVYRSTELTTKSPAQADHTCPRHGSGKGSALHFFAKLVLVKTGKCQNIFVKKLKQARFLRMRARPDMFRIVASPPAPV